MRRIINAYCDGACKGNPGRGGWGAVAFENLFPEFKNSETIGDGASLTVAPLTVAPLTVAWQSCGGKKITTNQEMELKAMLECLRICPVNSDIKITGDNQTVLKGLVQGGVSGTVTSMNGKVNFTGWIDGWTRHIRSSPIQNPKAEWKKADGKPPSNLELWKEIAGMCIQHIDSGSTLEFAWTKGHNGDPGNELADELANLGAEKYSR